MLNNILNNRKISRFFIAAAFLSLYLNGNKNTDLTSYHYDNRYKDASQIYNQEIAVLITAYNRPEYFSQCIKSIEQNPQSQSFIFIFALDGGPKSEQQQNVAIINSSTIKNKIILLRDRNYGCPKNHIDSKRFAFEWCKFKKVIILEEDIVITPSYFTFLLNLHEWATRKYANIGAVQGWAKCYLSKTQKKQKLNLVQENPITWNFITYCIDSLCWQKISPILYMFENFVDQIPHTPEYDKQRSKPYLWQGMKDIREWVHTLVNAKTKSPDNPHTLISKLSLRNFFLAPNFAAAQDVMMGFSFYMEDLIKLQPIVNRVLHIGKHGITTNEERYDRLYKPMKLDVYEEDKTLLSFKFINGV